MKKTIALTSALIMTLAALAAEPAKDVMPEPSCYSTMDCVQGNTNGKQLTYSVVKENIPPDGKKHPYNIQLFPLLKDGLPAGAYLLTFRMTANHDFKTKLLLMVHIPGWPTIVTKDVSCKANVPQEVSIAFSVEEKYANKPLRIPTIPCGLEEKGFTLVLSDFKIAKD